MKKFKTIIVILLSVVFSVLVIGCTSKKDDSILKVWGINPICMPGYEQILEMDKTNSTGLYSKFLIESFKTANPQVEISLETAGWELELSKNLVTAIAAGTQPDVTATATYTPLLARYGHLSEINLTNEIQSEMLDTLDTYAIHQGKRYAVPVTQSLFSLLINKGVLRKAGILNADNTVKNEWVKYNPLAPKTWEDLLVLSVAIKEWSKHQTGDNTKIGGTLMCSTTMDSHVRALAIMASAGGDFADNYGNIYLNSPENVKAYEYMRKLWQATPSQNLGATSLGSLHTLFFQGQAAYFVDAAETLIPIMSGNYPNAVPKDLLAVELPKFEGSTFKANVSTGGILFAVLSKSKNQESGTKFVQHFMSFEAQKNIFEIVGRIPMNKSVLKAIQAENSEKYQFSKSAIDPFLDSEYRINPGLPMFENNASRCWDAWNGMYIKVLIGQDNISQLLADCAQKWTNYSVG